MKARLKNDSGSVLLITLIITAVIGTALASYLKLAEYQNRSVVHSQYWNGGIPVAEAGVEEALAHLNKVGDGNRATNGWSYTNGSYHMTRTLPAGKYHVQIDTNAQPLVRSIGYVIDPVTGKEVQRSVRVLTSKAGSLMKGIIARDNITLNGSGVRIDSFDSEDPNYNTNGRYDSGKSKDGGFAGAVTGSINTGNGGVWGNVATGPNGTVTGNVGDNAWMASNSGVQPGHYRKDLNVSFPPVQPPFTTGLNLAATGPQNLTITNFTYLTNQITSTTYPSPVPAGGVTTTHANVTTATKPNTWSGTLTTNAGPFSSTTYPASGTYVGNVVSRNVVEGKGKNAKTVTYYDYNKITGYTYQTVAYTYNNVTTNTSTTTDSYTYVTTNGNYHINQLNMSGHQKMLVRGNTVLYVSGSAGNAISLTGGDAQIIIMPGASLKIYAGGNVSLGGKGVMNGNTSAINFQLFGLPGCQEIDFKGNASFTGVVYAPNAYVHMGGGGNNNYDTVGAVTAKAVKLNGHFNFHFDEMLARVSGPELYKVASWNEI